MSISLKSPLGAALAAASLTLAVPGIAQAGGGHHRGGDGPRGGDVPTRVGAPLARAARALDRAEERIEDGESDRAVTALGSVRSNLAAAVKAAKRRVAGETGPDSVLAVVSAQHRVVVGSANLFDGESGAVVDGIAATLDAALDGRDELLGAIPADSDAYGDVFAAVVADTGDEVESLNEVKADDTLTSEASAAIDAALAQIAATGTAASARSGSAEDVGDYAGAEYDGADYAGEGPRRKCRKGERGPRGPGGPGEGAGYPTDAPQPQV